MASGINIVHINEHNTYIIDQINMYTIQLTSEQENTIICQSLLFNSAESVYLAKGKKLQEEVFAVWYLWVVENYPY